MYAVEQIGPLTRIPNSCPPIYIPTHAISHLLVDNSNYSRLIYSCDISVSVGSCFVRRAIGVTALQTESAWRTGQGGLITYARHKYDIICYFCIATHNTLMVSNPQMKEYISVFSFSY